MKSKFTLIVVFSIVLLSFATALEKKGEYEGHFDVDVGDAGIDFNHSGCTENWACSYYTSCDGSTQTFVCADCNHCGTTLLRPASCGETIDCSPGENGGNGGNGGSGGNGGNGGTGITVKTSCTEKWTCSDWSECEEGKQTRTCTDEKNCNTTKLKPVTSVKCDELPGNETQTNLSELDREETSFFSSITGAFVGALGPTGALGTFIFIIAIIALIILSYAMKKKQKK